jgi:hypothetical protein
VWPGGSFYCESLDVIFAARGPTLLYEARVRQADSAELSNRMGAGYPSETFPSRAARVCADASFRG